jgi:hypothetical protein
VQRACVKKKNINNNWLLGVASAPRRPYELLLLCCCCSLFDDEARKGACLFFFFFFFFFFFTHSSLLLVVDNLIYPIPAYTHIPSIQQSAPTDLIARSIKRGGGLLLDTASPSHRTRTHARTRTSLLPQEAKPTDKNHAEAPRLPPAPRLPRRDRLPTAAALLPAPQGRRLRAGDAGGAAGFAHASGGGAPDHVCRRLRWRYVLARARTCVCCGWWVVQGGKRRGVALCLLLRWTGGGLGKGGGGGARGVCVPLIRARAADFIIGNSQRTLLLSRLDSIDAP